jgi:hypothetical protein
VDAAFAETAEAADLNARAAILLPCVLNQCGMVPIGVVCAVQCLQGTFSPKLALGDETLKPRQIWCHVV